MVLRARFPLLLRTVRPSSGASFIPPANLTNTPSTSDGLVKTENSIKLSNVSKAMKAYLEKAQAHELFMKTEVAEFELGKRHLANIMGWDPDAITQEDIDKAIEYLMPSGLTSLRSRPVMKHPELLWPKRKPPEFGMDGRPFHCLFYTRKPNFYQLLYDVAEKIEVLQAKEDAMRLKGVTEFTDKLSLVGSVWLSQIKLSDLMNEQLFDQHYAQFVATMEHLASLPNAALEREFIMKHRRFLEESIEESDDIQLPPDSDSVPKHELRYAKAIGTRKACKAYATVKRAGSGTIVIDGFALQDLYTLQAREIILAPLIVTNRLAEFDIEATTEWFRLKPYDGLPNSSNLVPNGEMARCGAVRLAIARALSALLPDADVTKLRLTGLLTRDPRRKERHVYNRKGPRSRYRWLKR